MKTFKEWMIEQGAWEAYLENLEAPIDEVKVKSSRYKFIIAIAFDWKNAKNGDYEYWCDLDAKWFEYLKENTIMFD